MKKGKSCGSKSGSMKGYNKGGKTSMTMKPYGKTSKKKAKQ